MAKKPEATPEIGERMIKMRKGTLTVFRKGKEIEEAKTLGFVEVNE